MQYRPRGMPSRFMAGAPKAVTDGVIDIIEIIPPAPLNFDILFRPPPGRVDEVVGLDFDADGWRGCHFFLKPHEARDYRERGRRRRGTWASLPEPTKQAIITYLTED